MRFTPLTEQQIKALGLITPGDYPFEVIAAEDKVSQSNNDMIKLTLKIWDENGKERQIDDYLLEAMPKKFFHFCRHTGLDEKYQAGSLMAEHCIGKSGYVKIATQKGKKKDDGTYFDDKSGVVDYLPKDTKIAKPATSKAEPGLDDDLPF